MDVQDRLQRLAEALPETGSVILTRADLLELAEADESKDASAESLADFTVAQVAEMFERSPQTVRDWIKAGRLRGYRLNDREYRITASALREFQEEQRNGASHGDRAEEADLGAWRDIVAR